eukprot:NODE_6843_length_1632_cov_9.301661.p1 GENE.NODE_6843_length_1632_cov_9.301661~~NODE_6843_length_1632_cov_9.301661.p1  ORF type:complete len:505 (-),score=151.58 NODE_6843_length_1632_cov_9.301661:118-1440(-)
MAQIANICQSSPLALSHEVVPLSCRHASTCRAKENLDLPVFGFVWALIPAYLERAVCAAALAASGRRLHQALFDGQRLRVGHLHVHPNSVAPAGPQCVQRFGSVKAGGCFARTSLVGLVSIEFYLPQLVSALWLLDGLARSGCCNSLRKIVDRQCRWLPRAYSLEDLCAIKQQRCAALGDLLGGALPSLHTLEGPVFSPLLRARGVVRKRRETDDPQSDPQHDLARPERQSVGCNVQALHLLDVRPFDLFGLWEPMYTKLQKLILLNLPSTSPGDTTMSISKFLPKAPNLEELQLDFQYFPPSHWELEPLDELVTRVQQHPSKVKKLLLEWCRLGNSGVDCVCQALARNARPPNDAGEAEGITELSLAHCELQDILSICTMLSTPGLALTKLDLSSNGLDDSQASHLVEVLPASNIKELLLRDSHVSIPLPVKTEWFWGC